MIVKMAAAGEKGIQKFKIGSGIELTISHEDIVDTSAISVAVGEDPALSGSAAVSKHLLEKCPRDYRERRNSLKKKVHEFQTGDIHSCVFKKNTPSSSKTVGFNTVYIAIVPPMRDGQWVWSKEMAKLYKNLFECASRDGHSSLALPLLGSGGARASVVDAAEVFIKSLQDVGHSTLKDISLHINPKDPKAYREATTVIQRVLTPSAASKSSGARHLAASSHFSADSSENSSTSSFTSSQEDRLQKTFSGLKIDKDNSNLTKILGIESGEADVSGMKRSLPNDADGCSEESECVTDKESKAKGCHGEKTVDKSKDKTWHQNEDDKCPICLDKIDKPKKLEKCGHIFCSDCIEDTFRHHKPACPTCNTLYGVIIGNQPASGTMTVSKTNNDHIPGYGNYGIITIDYTFPSGTQGKEHPNPGCHYRGTSRRAFLPNNEEGKKVCRLLRVAFENRLVFTVGTSKTTGADNVVTWNDIHHKTSISGGPTKTEKIKLFGIKCGDKETEPSFGYPDPLYLSRVQEELAARGITEDCLRGRHFDV